jgi:methionyl-tRNA formyltransferase
MKIKILGDKEIAAVQSAREIVRALGHKIVERGADVAIAPLLTTKISEEEINEPLFGTLIFHPSPLPYGRGARAIRWA